jgi:ABC-type transporter Mla MlaB component
MTWKIDRHVEQQRFVVLRLCGRLGRDDVDTLREAIGREKGPLAIDLTEVTLVDREAVTLLASCELNGIGLRNCSAYLREWVTKERESR